MDRNSHGISDAFPLSPSTPRAVPPAQPSIIETFLERRAARKAAVMRSSSEPPASLMRTLGSRHPYARVSTSVGARLNPSSFAATETSRGRQLVFKGFTTSSAPVSPRSWRAAAFSPGRARALAISDLALRTPMLLDMPGDLHNFRGQTGFLVKPMEGMRATNILCCGADNCWSVWLRSVTGGPGRWQTTSIPIREKDDLRRTCPELHEELIQACKEGSSMLEISILASRMLLTVLRTGGTIPFDEANKRLLELDDLVFVPLAAHNATDPSKAYRPLLKAGEPTILMNNSSTISAAPNVCVECQKRNNAIVTAESKIQQQAAETELRGSSGKTEVFTRARPSRRGRRQLRVRDSQRSWDVPIEYQSPWQPAQCNTYQSAFNPLAASFYPPVIHDQPKFSHIAGDSQGLAKTLSHPADDFGDWPIEEPATFGKMCNHPNHPKEESSQARPTDAQMNFQRRQDPGHSNPRSPTASEYKSLKPQISLQYFHQQQQFGYGQPYEKYRDLSPSQQRPSRPALHTHRELFEAPGVNKAHQKHHSRDMLHGRTQNLSYATHPDQKDQAVGTGRLPSPTRALPIMKHTHSPPRGRSLFDHPQTVYASPFSPTAHHDQGSQAQQPPASPWDISSSRRADSPPRGRSPSVRERAAYAPVRSSPRHLKSSLMGLHDELSPSESLTAIYHRNQAIEHAKAYHQLSKTNEHTQIHLADDYASHAPRIPFATTSPHSEHYQHFSGFPLQAVSSAYPNRASIDSDSQSFYRLSQDNPFISGASGSTASAGLLPPEKPNLLKATEQESLKWHEPGETRTGRQSNTSHEAAGDRDSPNRSEAGWFESGSDIVSALPQQEIRAPSPEGRRRSEQHKKLFGPKGVLARSETLPPSMPLTADTRFSPLQKVSAFAGKLVEKGFKRQPGDVAEAFRRVGERINRSISPSRDRNFFQRHAKDDTGLGQTTTAAGGITTHEPEERRMPQISMPPGEQMWLLAQVEFVLTMAANDFLLEQKEAGRLSAESVQRVVGAWLRRNRPQPRDFLFPLATQHDLVQANADRLLFHGPAHPLPGTPVARASFMNAWRNLIRDLSYRTFCLPDHALKKIIVDGFRVLEMLGAQSDAFIEFRDMQLKLAARVVDGAARRERDLRSDAHAVSAEHGVTRKVTTPLLLSTRGLVDDEDRYYDDGIYKGPVDEDFDSPIKRF